MRLLPWRAEPTAPPVATPPTSAQPSLAIAHVLNRLEGAPRCGVLDLGAPLGANLAIYADHGARISFADFYRFYAPARSAGASAHRIDDFLPHAATRIDVVLAWDLFDYLTPEEMTWLQRGLSERCAPSAILLALVSCQGQIPASPGHYSIVDAKTLMHQAAGPPSRPSPEHSEHLLIRSLPGVTVENRFQLRNATVEYLFTYRRV